MCLCIFLEAVGGGGMQVEVYVVRVVYFPRSYNKTREASTSGSKHGSEYDILPWDLSGETGKKV